MYSVTRSYLIVSLNTTKMKVVCEGFILIRLLAYYKKVILFYLIIEMKHGPKWTGTESMLCRCAF